MAAQRQPHTERVEQLFLKGKRAQEIQDITGLSKNVVIGIIYRGRQCGRLPRPAYTQAYDDRRNSYIRRGTIGHVLEKLSPEQHKYITDEALRVGCNNMAEMIAAFLIDAIAEEMEG